MLYFWIAAIVILVVVEAITPQLMTIWFALGALGAMIAALLKAPEWSQWIIFVTVSLLSLVLTRPLVKKFTNKKIIPTNVDRIIGERAVVTESINNTLGQGLVTVKGRSWTARSLNDELIESGSCVIVKKIDGVKVLVVREEE